MLEIYRVDHISQVVPELDPQAELMEGLFGYRRLRSFDNAEVGARGVRYEVQAGHHWEILAPTGADSPLQAWLDDNGGRGGLHHVAVEVPDLEAATKELDNRGIEPTGGAPGRWVEAPLSPPDAGPGVLFRISGPGDHVMCGDELSDQGVRTPETRRATPLDPQASSAAPPLGVVAIDHVCQAFADRDVLAKWYADLAGFVQVWRTPTEEHPDMADLVMNIPGSSICWEIIMPRGQESFIERFLERSGPAAHHVTLEVADFDRALQACEQHEVEPFGSNEGTTDGAKWRDTFLHPKVTGGVLTQLFWEERPGVWVRSDKIPATRTGRLVGGSGG